MITKLLKENLPWVVPTAAFVFVAYGYFELQRETTRAEILMRSSDTDGSGAAPTTSATDATVVAAAAKPTFSRGMEGAEQVTRQSTLEPSFEGYQTSAEPAREQLQAEEDSASSVKILELLERMEAQVKAAEEAEAKPEPVATASLEANPAAFFRDAQANLSVANSCKADLRSLAAEARVYFPSGGLNADANGIEQARLIGVVAQNCEGVQIQIEGHSDASGDPSANFRLSELRAKNVLTRIGAAGVDTRNFVIKGFGDRSPSRVTGPESSAYYDRRVEFSVIETTQTASLRGTANQWASPSCVAELEAAVAQTNLFYAPRSISVVPRELDAVLDLASKAVACPSARLRVIGHHSDDAWAGEDINTGILRAKALMTMLVGRGIKAEQVIIAAPSRSVALAGRPDMPNSRIDFDVIVDNR